MPREKELDLDDLIQPARDAHDLLSVNVSTAAKAKVEGLRKRMKDRGHDFGSTIGLIVTRAIEQLDAKFPGGYATNGKEEL